MENKEKIKNLILEIGILEIENILNDIKKEKDNKEETKQFFLDCLNKCKVTYSDPVYEKYSNCISWKDNNGWDYFVYIYKTNTFYCDYTNVWSVFENRFGLKCKEIKEIITELVSSILNYNDVTLEKLRG